MKKSSRVPATFVVALAASFAASGCGRDERQCVDAQGRVLPDSACRQPGGVAGAHWNVIRSGFGGGYSSGYSGGGFFGS